MCKIKLTMDSFFIFSLLFLIITLIAGCSQSTTDIELLTPSPTFDDDQFFFSQGGGEPRLAGYWLLWNSCTADNRAETAAANGGRAAGWIILDDILKDPGILLGELQVVTCEQGINLLQGLDLDGNARGGDAAYQLAAQLLVAQVNLAVGAEYCPASDQAVAAGQLLLIGLGFNGRGGYLGLPVDSQDIETAEILIDQLAQYNAGELCK